MANETLRAARQYMVEHDLRGRGIADPHVLAAMGTVPRHRFVPADLQAEAYADGALPIGAGQTISQPYVVALMTELLELTGGERVLEVGTGSGYQAAVLSEIGCQVYTIEIRQPLAEAAARLLAELGYDSIHVRAGDGYAGWPEAAPFDAAVITAASPRVPEPIAEQLQDGGTIVLPLGTDSHQTLVRGRKKNGKIRLESVTGVAFVPMTGEIRAPTPPR